MSYTQAAGIITLSYLLDDLFEYVSRETYAIAKNKFGDKGPLVDQLAMSADERFFFNDYLEDAMVDILGSISKLTYTIDDPVTLDSTNLTFKINDKGGYKISTLKKFDEEIKKTIQDFCISEWLLKVEQFDLAKTHGIRFEAGKAKITNLSVELRKPTLS